MFKGLFFFHFAKLNLLLHNLGAVGVGGRALRGQGRKRTPPLSPGSKNILQLLTLKFLVATEMTRDLTTAGSNVMLTLRLLPSEVRSGLFQRHVGLLT